MLYFCLGCIMLLNLASWGHMLTNPHFTFLYFILVLKDALFNKASFHYPCKCVMYRYKYTDYISIYSYTVVNLYKITK